MKITVYTINDCTFSQAEKEYLKKNNLEFEERNLETNRDFLTEMLAISNNFAGTPVTQIEKDNGEKIILKGFTADEFDKALGIATVPVQAVSDDQPQQQAQQVQPVAPEPPQATSPEPVQAAPVVIESLSEDTSQVTAPAISEPPMPPISTEPIEPSISQQTTSQPQMPPAQPPAVANNVQDLPGIEPISLDITEPAPQMPTENAMQPPVQIEQPAMQVPSQQQPQPNPLDSVLQNLQSQVGDRDQKKENGPNGQQM